jgi:hypothetical protein
MSSTYESEMAKKLNLKSGMAIHVMGQPGDVDLSGVPTGPLAGAAAVLLFAPDLAAADTGAELLVKAAGAGQLVWVAYPKAGQLGTDLNRDILRSYLAGRGLDAVRQIAIDEVWSALRFKAG